MNPVPSLPRHHAAASTGETEYVECQEARSERAPPGDLRVGFTSANGLAPWLDLQLRCVLAHDQAVEHDLARRSGWSAAAS